MNIREAIAQYLEVRKVERRLQANSVKTIGAMLRRVFASVMEMDADHLSFDHVRIGLGAVEEGNAHNYSVNLRSHLRPFCEWLHRDGITTDNMAKNIRQTRKRINLPRFIETPGEIINMVSHMDPFRPHDVRSRAAFLISYAAALRFCELQEMKVKDFLPSMNTGALNVHAMKDGLNSYAILPGFVTEQVQQYLTIARPLLVVGEDPGYLFLGAGGKKLGYNLYRKWIREIGEAAGLPFNLTSHVLRHSFATHRAMEGVDPYVLKEMMRHRSIVSTLAYVHMVDDHIGREYQRVMGDFGRRETTA